MKKIPILIILVLIAVPNNFAAAATRVFRWYGSLDQEGSYWLDGSDQIWDLTKCDLYLSYAVDMSAYTPDWQQTDWTMVGLGSGVWAWMTSGAPLVSESNPGRYDLDDKLHLGGMPSKFDESNYDSLFPDHVGQSIIGDPYINYGIWFDRDGISPHQTNLWGQADGATYNTGGVYNIDLSFHAISPQLGTVFATVNGIQTGFYDQWQNGQPDYFPVGMSFSGDLSRVRVFASLWGQGVNLGGIYAHGCPRD